VKFSATLCSEVQKEKVVRKPSSPCIYILTFLGRAGRHLFSKGKRFRQIHLSFFFGGEGGGDRI
jgi:hypothetical protein